MYNFNSDKNSLIRIFIPLCVIVFLTISGSTSFYAQSKKESLTFDDIRQWRTHSVALSDNGDWYTTIYNLSDKPEDKKDKEAEEKNVNFFDDNNKTDVLYIAHTKNGIKYKIPKASKPIFSSSSKWIAYQIKDESNKEINNKEAKSIIELKHLESGFTVKYNSESTYQFPEGKDYFLTADKNSLLIYDLNNRREHYIGNIGEYLVDKKSNNIFYTIASEDKRGNGIYLFNPSKLTTKALETGSFIYSNLAWNHNINALASYRYNIVDSKVDYSNMNIVVINGINSETSKSIEYPVKEIKGMPVNMAPAIKFDIYSNEIVWSNDGERLFIKIKLYNQKDEKKDKDNVSDGEEEEATVQIWHWKDKKLLSERIIEHESKENETFEAIFFCKSNTLIQLTGKDIQKLVRSKGTDNWAIGTDNQEYISDWDISTHDLYRIDLKTGEKKLIEKKYRSIFENVQISPDGTKAILWDEEHYWCYDFEKNTKRNITKDLAVSFIDCDYDKFGYKPNYGFVGWVKDHNAIIVNHKLDLWILPVDVNEKAQNLTVSVTSKDSIRFRFEDPDFFSKPEIKERYIDFSKPNILYVFNIQTKYAGYYNLQHGQLKELIYKPVSFSSPYRRYNLIKSKNSDAIIYKMGDYKNYPESYLSTLNFANPKKISNTNPQGEQFKWGKRILIDYTNDDGVPLQGILSIPENYKLGRKLPMIVYSYEKHSEALYTYPSNYLSGTSIPEMLYVSSGYLFLQPDIHFNLGTPHSDMHECINAAIEKVIELGYVDEKRIGYQGYSFGGHAGMYISAQDNKFAAIAAGGGVSNLVQGFNLDIVSDGSNEQDYYMTGQGRLGTDPTSDTEMYISESPVFNAQNMNTPLLLFHGTDDKVVQWEHSFGFYSILRYLKKPVVFLSYQGEGHGLRSKESTRLDIQRRLKEYFDHYLKDGEEKKWMLEELPYESKVKSKENNKTQLKWK